jgi:hypothetical protein
VTLDVARASIKDDDEYYGYIGYAIVEGLMFEKLRVLKKHINSGSTKDLVAKGNLTSKVTRLVGQLKNSKINSR